MKFAKKFFVGILAVAMIVSCLTLSASAADAPKLPSENLSDVLEYLLYDDPFIVEDYDSEEVGAYEPVDSFFGFTKGNSALSIVGDSSADDNIAYCRKFHISYSPLLAPVPSQCRRQDQDGKIF